MSGRYVVTFPTDQEPWAREKSFPTLDLAMAEYIRLYPGSRAPSLLKIHRVQKDEVFYGEPTDKRVAAVMRKDAKGDA
jgi:hypothetical protein